MSKKNANQFAVVTINGTEHRIPATSFDELGEWVMDNFPSRWEEDYQDGDSTHTRGVAKPPRTELDKKLGVHDGAETDRTDLSLLDGATPNVAREDDDEAHAR